MACKYFILDTYATLENKDFFSFIDLDASISKLLDSRYGLLYGLLDDDMIVALQGVEFDTFLGVYKWNCNEPSQFVVSEIGWALVSSRYRGNRLTNILTIELENDAKLLHGCIKFIATVHPNNTLSLRAFFGMGYMGYSLVLLNQLPRVILAKNIFPQLSYPPSGELVNMGSFSFEKWLLYSQKATYGAELTVVKTSFAIRYLLSRQVVIIVSEQNNTLRLKKHIYN
jgi:hypothetical protein